MLPKELSSVAPHYLLQQIHFAKAQGFNDADMAVLAQLKDMLVLELGDASVTDAGVAKISHFQLRQLRLVNAPITDNGLPAIAKISGLNQLDLSGTQITDAGLEELTTLQLSMLALANTRITAKGLRTLVSTNGLGITGLNLVGISLGEPEYASLAGLRLFNLIVGHKNVTGVGLGKAGRSNLHQLTIVDGRLSEAGVKEIATQTILRTLTLQNCTISENHLKHLALLANLQELTFQASPLTDNHLAALGGLERLSKLEVSGTRISGDGFKKWKPNNTLTNLNLDNCRFTDAGAQAAIKALPNLQEIHVVNNPIREQGLAALILSPRMGYVKASGKDYSANAQRQLRTLKRDCSVSFE
jgi:Leucine-rich repeat (LRR) protein